MEITNEVEKFICNNYMGVKNKDLTEMINAEFHSDYTIKQIKWVKYKHHLNNGIVKRDLPLGTEKIKNGYTFVKVKNHPQKWIEKQRYIYEKEHGPVPVGYKVMFLNDDVNDFNTNNLALVKNSEVIFVNKNGYAKTNKIIKEPAINVARLNTKIKELEAPRKDV